MDERKKQSLLQQRDSFIAGLDSLDSWVDTVSPDRDLFDVDARLERLEADKKAFDAVQAELAAEDADRVTKLNEFNDKAVNLSAKMKRLRYQLSSAAGFAGSHSLLSGPYSAPPAVQVQVMPSNMPVINLRKFSGSNYLDYVEFRGVFDALVDQNNEPGMTVQKKFAVLKDHLEGIAYDAIKHLNFTPQNYEAAKLILDTRFKRPRLTFEALIRKLIDVPNVTGSVTIRTVIDQLNSHLKALELLPATGEQIGDGILMHIILNKLDKPTMAKWEEKSASKSELPSFAEFLTFLEKKSNAQESISFLHKGEKKKSDERANTDKKSYNQTLPICAVCKGNCPNVFSCLEFLKFDPRERFHWAKNNNFCTRCLKFHAPRRCFYYKKCTKCRLPHHDLLHFDDVVNKTIESATETATNSQMENETLQLSHSANINMSGVKSAKKIQVLGTVLLKIKAKNGDLIPARALLDSGSMIHFITKRLATQLDLNVKKTDVSISGMFGTSKVSQCTQFSFASLDQNYSSQIEAIIVDGFEHMHPAVKLDLRSLSIPDSVEMADPQAHIPQRIDLLLGVGEAYRCLLPCQKSLPNGLILQNSKFGWVLAGEFDETASCTTTNLSFLGVVEPEPEPLNAIIKFFEVEELPSRATILSNEQQFCENHFLQTCYRTKEGRFVVALPFKGHPSSLGGSVWSARSCLTAMEQKMKENTEVRNLYVDFMNEYEELGHMSPMNASQMKVSTFLSHHMVFKLDSTSTKGRVVFNASKPTSTGKSLNDVLAVGPTVQSSLFEVMLKFRFNPVAFCGDIAKMYRQILVRPEDRKFQSILWRRENQIVPFELNTVTYGTGPAAFLATRCLNELAKAEKQNHPKAAQTILEDFYVDDLLTGAQSADEAEYIIAEVSQVLSKGGFEIRKWVSNDAKLLCRIPLELQDTLVNFGEDSITKTLGLRWNPQSDEFLFVSECEQEEKWTKRLIVSASARIFDVLGLLGPVTCRCKILIQHLWKLKLSWDDEVPQDVLTIWNKIVNELGSVSELRFPRFVLSDQVDDVQLHGFADASGKAYGCMFFFRIRLKSGRIIVRLLCSRNKVAPLKKVTLPRLELLGGKLLADFFEFLWHLLQKFCSKTYLWLDAKVALTWITSEPHKYDLYVANRITQIQAKTKNCKWMHVPGKQNPADILSRGASPAELQRSKSWLNGPEFLYEDESVWGTFRKPDIEEDDSRLEKKEEKLIFFGSIQTDLVQEYPYRGSLIRIQKTFSFVYRFIQRCRRQPVSDTISMTSADFENGLKIAIKSAQTHYFYPEIHQLQQGKPVPSNSALRKLDPFLDEFGLIRVGGRLANAPGLSRDEKHPIIIPKDHAITKTIFFHFHFQLKHPGPSNLLAFIRRKFWPLGGKIHANQITWNCVVCTRMKQSPPAQLMGDLPTDRLQIPERCFEITTVDLFGPFQIVNQGRGAPRTPIYVALFEDFAISAVQLHYVEDLSTAKFLNTLTRFISRAGCPRIMWSDNAKNFEGTREILNRLDWERIKEWSLNTHRIEWKHPPAVSPHRSGKVEAGVKLAKTQLIKIIQNTSIQRDDFETFLSMVEAVLNSRPLVPLSLSPNDGQPLTPAHFMIGCPLVPLPDPTAAEFARSKSDLVRRYQHLIELKRHWQTQFQYKYFQTLQQRSKWLEASQNIKVGDFVMLKESDFTSPFSWPVATVTGVFPDAKGRVRTIDVVVKGASNQRTLQRDIRQIVLIPTGSSRSSSVLELGGLVENSAI